MTSLREINGKGVDIHRDILLGYTIRIRYGAIFRQDLCGQKRHLGVDKKMFSLCKESYKAVRHEGQGM